MVLYPRNGGRSGPKTRKMRRLRSDFRRDSRARHYRCCRPVCFVPPHRQATAIRWPQAITAFLRMAICTPQNTAKDTLLTRSPRDCQDSLFSHGRAFPHPSFSHRSDPPRTPKSMRRPFTRSNLTGGKPGLFEDPARIFSYCATPTDRRSTGVSRCVHHPVRLNISLLSDANQQSPFLAKLKGPMKGANDDAEE